MQEQSSVWLIANSASGSHDADAIAAITRLYREAGRPIGRTIELGEAPLPSAQEATRAGVGQIILFGGDGTITAAAGSMTGWDGEFLVLPGGTMNLLARALHGDCSPVVVAERAAREKLPALRVPTITGAGQCALAGVIAGPTSAWGDVREDARHLDIPALAGSVGEAIAQTFSGDMVRLGGRDNAYKAVYLQPGEGGIAARGILTRGPGDLLAHGIAWLGGDFRDGPNEALGIMESVTLHCDSPMGLLVDGERAEGATDLQFRAGRSAHRYLSCRGKVVWS